jgi:uncharacterized protein (TIRG00374 family)
MADTAAVVEQAQPDGDAAGVPGLARGRKLALFLLGSVLLAAGIAIAMLWWAHVRHLELVPTLRAVGWAAIAAALGLHLASQLVWALRLWVVGRGTGSGISFGFAFRLVTAGVFGAAVTPGRAGGEGLRYYLLRRRHPDPDHAMRFLVADRTLDLAFFLLAGIPAAIVLPTLLGGDFVYRAFALAGVGLVAVALVLLLLLVADVAWVRAALRPLAGLAARLMPSLGPRLLVSLDLGLRHTREGLALLLRERRLHLAVAALLTLGTWVLEFMVLWVLLRAFGFPVGLLAVLLGAVVLNLVTAAAATPGSAGVAELAALAIYQGMAPGLSPIFVVLWRLVTYGYDLGVGGLVAVGEGVLTLGRRKPAQRTV